MSRLKWIGFAVGSVWLVGVGYSGIELVMLRGKVSAARGNETINQPTKVSLTLSMKEGDLLTQLGELERRFSAEPVLITQMEWHVSDRGEGVLRIQ
jgi:hypothetical protein